MDSIKYHWLPQCYMYQKFVFGLFSIEGNLTDQVLEFLQLK